MQRAVRILAIGFVLAGLELSTSGISFTLGRLRAGLGAISAGVEFHTTPAHFLLGLGACAFGVGVWWFVAWTRRASKVARHSGDECPKCGGHTDRVKRRPWHRWAAAVTGYHLTRRKCGLCGWTGLSIGGSASHHG